MKPETVRNNILQVMLCLEGGTHHRLTASDLVRATAADAVDQNLDHDVVAGVESGGLAKMLSSTREAIRYLEGSHLVVAEGCGWKLTGAGRLIAHKLLAVPALIRVANKLEKLLVAPHMSQVHQPENSIQPQAQAS